jgi:hypothetical protein
LAYFLNPYGKAFVPLYRTRKVLTVIAPTSIGANNSKLKAFTVLFQAIGFLAVAAFVMKGNFCCGLVLRC